MPVTIRGLAKLLKLAVAICDAIDIFGPRIRVFVPDPDKIAYDNALNTIKASCEVLRAINYLDGWSGTNPPFGPR